MSTTGTDADWVVKLIDVYPGDYPNPTRRRTRRQAGPRREACAWAATSSSSAASRSAAKFRNSFEKPSRSMTPGKPATIAFELPDVYHTFRRGHRIMVQVQSTWFPLVDRNPQTFVDIPKATASEYQKATERVYAGGARGSSNHAAGAASPLEA